MNFLEKISIISEYITKYFFYIMFILVIVNILLRYIFNINFIFMQELVMYLHAFIFLFGISICLKENSHVRIDVFSNKLDAKAKKYIEVLGTVFLIIPFCLFVLYESTPIIIRSWEMLESSGEPGGLPFIYILKSAIYVFASLLLIQALGRLVK
ncbi:MAG: TRAP transporter small permease subunit [Gammaproteobacteria bacterium]|jgi:TRAP-type mannitol/chloroaromatic compound transport system permease small subunit